MKRLIIFLALLVILLMASLLWLKKYPDSSQNLRCPMDAMICADGSAVGRIGPMCEFAPCPKVTEKNDDISVTEPSANALVGSPLIIQGEARGNWFFEASFPVRLLDENGEELAVTSARALGDWMTTDFVLFEATIMFSPPTTSIGTVVLEKDNPSGLPENSDEIRIPVRFAP